MSLSKESVATLKEVEKNRKQSKANAKTKGKAEESTKKQSGEVKRSNCWAAVIYPDSMPENWKTILEETYTPVWVSPLHDSDKEPDGKPKKAHYHIMIRFNTLKSYEQVSDITSKLKGSIPIRLDNFKGYLRYLTHLDNPDKHQYKASDIVMLNGATYDITVELTKAQKYQGLREMGEYISTNNVCEYIDFFNLCALENEIWFQILCDCGSIVVSNLITSQRNKNKCGLVRHSEPYEDI